MILKNAKIYISGEIREGFLLIQKEIITSISLKPNQENLNMLRSKNEDGIEINCGQRLILPGIIDIHSHLRDMGQEEKETFRTGTKAAAFSGITTLFNMPNTIPPATTSDRIKEWMNKAKNNIYVDIGFITGVPEAMNQKEIRKIIDLGIIGFKIYPLNPLSGINWLDSSNIKQIILISSKYQIPIFIHPDWPTSKLKKERLLEINIQKGNPLLKIYNELHPIKYEVKFIKYVLDNCTEIIRENNLSPDKYPIIHFCHISCKKSIEEFKHLYDSKQSSLFYEYNFSSNISFEVTPHHLLLSDNIELEVPSYGKVLPPLRTKSNSKFLLNELRKENIKYIGTDHAPHTLEEKALPFFEAPSGFPGFETYSVLLLDKVFRDRLQLRSFIKAASENPAKKFKLNMKGFINENYYADLIIVEKSKDEPIDSQKFKSKAKYTPFENSNFSDRLTSAKIWKVFLRGKEINIENSLPTGKIIRM